MFFVVVFVITNPRRACAARVTLVGLSLCVDAYSGTIYRLRSGLLAIYQRIQNYASLKSKRAIS